MRDGAPRGRALPVPASRLARLGRLGAMTAGVAGSMALQGAVEIGRGKRPDMRDLLLTPGNMRRITEQLAKMRGAAMKVGQLLSMDSGDVLPPELADILSRLRSDAHFMPPRQLRQVLDAQWGTGWLQRFERFDVRPIAAASIGQVHRAQTRDGRDLAIKVQYPGIARSIDSDVANVGALIGLSGLLPKGLDLAPYLAEAARQLHEETDYRREGHYLARFGALLGADARLALPQLQEDWTTGQVLAMTHVSGMPIETASDAPQEMRDRISGILIDLMLRELFEFGVMQTDPNFANYRFDPDSGRIVLLDFGAARELDPTIMQLYRRILIAGLADDPAEIRNVAAEIGFFTPDTPPEHVDRILGMIALVFEALRAAPEFDFAGTELPNRMQAEGQALAEAGFVPPTLPMDVLYLQRKFGGMFLLAARLGARLPLGEMLARHLEDPDLHSA